MNRVSINNGVESLVYLIFYHDVFHVQFSAKAIRGFKKLFVVFLISFLINLMFRSTVLGQVSLIIFAILSIFFLAIGVDIIRKRVMPYFRNQDLIQFYKSGVELIYDSQNFTLTSGDDRDYCYLINRIEKTWIVKESSIIVQMKDGGLIYLPFIKAHDLRIFADFIDK